MPDIHRVFYWDACVWLSYVNEIPDRVPVIEALLDDSANGQVKLYTSELSRVEVAFGASEQTQRHLDEGTEKRIDGLWANQRSVGLVEHHATISIVARGFMRASITRGWSLKPLDAVHLATAQWLKDSGIPVAEFHTYDNLARFGSLVDGFSIAQPHVLQLA